MVYFHGYAGKKVHIFFRLVPNILVFFIRSILVLNEDICIKTVYLERARYFYDNIVHRGPIFDLLNTVCDFGLDSSIRECIERVQ